MCSLKETPKGIIPKARLVARGFEEDNIENIKKGSRTCSRDTLRVVLSVVAHKQWTLQSIDIKTAFLQGDNLSRDVYVNPPAEAQCDKSILWKLNKCIYGLSDASLQWYNSVKRFILSCGGKVSKSDPALFLWHKSNELNGAMIIHVDDFLWAGSDEFKNNVIEKLCKKYVVSKFEPSLFRFVGLNLKQQNNTITIEQYKYIERIKMIEIDTKRKIQHNEPLTEQEKTVLRSKIGQLLWVNNQTRPDISFELCHLSTNFRNATVNDIIQTNKVIKKLKQSPGHLTYVPIENDPKIIVYTDASFGNLVDSGSQGAFLIFLVDGKQNCN